MQRQSFELNDFTGGMNAQDRPHALAEHEFVGAQDAIVDGHGQLRRRGAYIDHPWTSPDPGSPHFVFGGQRKAVCAGRHSYHADARGTFIVTGDDDLNESRLYFMPQDGEAFRLFTVDGVAATHGQVADGFTPPLNKDPDIAEKHNSKNNVSVIGCDAFTVAVKADKNRPFDGSAGANQFRLEHDVEDDTYYFEVTVIALGDDPDATLSGVGAQLPGVYPYVCTVERRTFLAGRRKMAQHFWWSDYENSHAYGGDESSRREHVPTNDNSSIRALANVSGSLAIVKEHSIHMLRVSFSPADWELRQRTEVGTCDVRSLWPYQDGIIFANQYGVWMFNGLQAVCLTDKLARYWRAQFKSWNLGWTVAAAGFQDHYVVCAMDETNAVKRLLCLHIPSGAWTMLTNLSLRCSCPAPFGNTTYGFTQSGRIVELASMFRGQTGRDPEGDGPTFSVTLGRMTAGEQSVNKAWKEVQVLYQATVASGEPFLRMSVSTGLDPDSPYVTVADLPAREVEGKQRVRLGKRSSALSVRLHEEPNGGEFNDVIVTGLVFGYQRMRDSRADG